MQAGSDLFGKQRYAEIEFGSLAGSHTNQGLVAVVCGVESDYEEPTMDGRMSQAKIEKNRPLMAPVFEDGMRWLVLNADAIKLFPELPKLTQAARQATGQVQKVEGIVELLEAIQSMVSQSGDTNWDEIIDTVGQSESPFKPEIPKLCEYARLYGGGEKG